MCKCIQRANTTPPPTLPFSLSLSLSPSLSLSLSLSLSPSPAPPPPLSLCSSLFLMHHPLLAPAFIRPLSSSPSLLFSLSIPSSFAATNTVFVLCFCVFGITFTRHTMHTHIHTHTHTYTHTHTHLPPL